MPKLNGLAVLKQIRSVDSTQPVIVLTGDTNPEREQEVRALGVSEFIIKGSSLQFLEDTLKRLLKAPSPSSQPH
jgi:DNA-binding NarL/FixJ family response regulator